MTTHFADVPGGALRIRVRGPENGHRLLVLHGDRDCPTPTWTD